MQFMAVTVHLLTYLSHIELLNCIRIEIALAIIELTVCSNKSNPKL